MLDRCGGCRFQDPAVLGRHGYPQRYDLAAYRALFGFPSRTTTAVPGRILRSRPSRFAARFMEHYNAGVPGCAVTAHAGDAATNAGSHGLAAGNAPPPAVGAWSSRYPPGVCKAFYRVARPCGHLRRKQGTASTDYLRRTGIDRRPLCDGRRHRLRCRGGCGHRVQLIVLYTGGHQSAPGWKRPVLRHRRPCPAAALLETIIWIWCFLM